MSSQKPTIIITGAAGGIGSGFVFEFLKTAQAKEYHAIYMHHPSAPGALSSILSKKAPKGHTYEILPLDLSVQAEIRKFCTEVNGRIASGELGAIKVLMLIAGGIFTSPPKSGDGSGLEFSTDGIEMTFAVNYLANFLLSVLLLPSMGKGEEGSGSGSRIVFLSSTTHDPSFGSNAFAITRPEHHVLFDGVEGLVTGTYQPAEDGGKGKGERFAAALRRYGCAKLCLVLFMYEFQNRLNASAEHQRVAIIAHDPAAVGGTNHYEAQTFPLHLYVMLKYLMVPVQAVVCWFWPNGPMRTTAQVGRDLCFAAWDEGLEGKGAVYLDGRTVVESSAESMDGEKQGRLWKETVQLLGVKKEDVGVQGII